MTESEKIQFVTDITKLISKEVIRLVKTNRLPTTWDSIELRQILADKFMAATWKEGGERIENYKSEVLIRDLL